jgi:hypothetical protein
VVVCAPQRHELTRFCKREWVIILVHSHKGLPRQPQVDAQGVQVTVFPSLLLVYIATEQLSEIDEKGVNNGMGHIATDYSLMFGSRELEANLQPKVEEYKSTEKEKSKDVRLTVHVPHLQSHVHITQRHF